MAKLIGYTGYYTIFLLALLSFNPVICEDGAELPDEVENYLNDTSTDEKPIVEDKVIDNFVTDEIFSEENSERLDHVVTERLDHEHSITNENLDHVSSATESSENSDAENATEINNISSTEDLDDITKIEDVPEPSFFFSSVHRLNEKEYTINHLSHNLLTATKDILSTSPRTYRNVSMQQRLLELQKLSAKDVAEILAQRGMVVPPLKGVSCDANTQHYRTMDGSCNNVIYTCWGKADEPYLRWLPPAYANGIDEPRKRADGNPLPSPREVYQWVSSQLEQNSSTTHQGYSNLVVVWGQMLAHDIILTPTVTIKSWVGKEFKEEEPNCCESGMSHPDCIPIVMKYDDGYYSRGHCMNIARSAAYSYSPYSCQHVKLGMQREQMNQVTTFIDGSLVYGSSEKQMRKLRENNGYGARLMMDYIHGVGYPPRQDAPCKSASNSCDKRCFLTGEKRANENPILASMHTIWIREHNRLVNALSKRGWNEETLFHVVRKIIGSIMQHISYKEYLPVVIGPGLAEIMNLTVPTNYYRYDPYVNPTLYNSFITAAFRYGHSQISEKYLRRGRNYAASPYLSQDFFSMDDYCSPQGDSIANLLYGQTDQKAQKVDCLFSKQVTNHLFAKTVNGAGMDLFSVNIQRGREHGLPPYNKWRETCGLPKAYDYGDLRGIIPDYVVDRLSNVYGPGGVDEIDLFVGGVSEYPINGGILGPTFTCIVSNQFKNLKFGDRFWYENTDHPGAFSTDQINSIRKTTLASLLCRNSDIKYIQPMAFRTESYTNPKLPCDVILKDTDLNLNLW